MGPDDKLVCVPLSNPMWVDVRDVGDSSALRAEIEQFFEVYKALEGEPTQTAGSRSRAEALQVLDQAVARKNEASHYSPQEVSA